jgi:5'-deoxynucleotidase YfbR-like HD superfamily hydrolase
LATRLKNQILTHRKMSSVDRMSTSLKNRRYNLAEHSYYVASMFEDFARAENLPYSTEDMYFVMRHDYLEAITTDLIYPIKKLSKVTSDCWDTIEAEIIKQKESEFVNLFSDEDLKEALDPLLYHLMKTCDFLDLFLFCLEEAFLGNITVELRHIIETLKPIILDSGFESVKSFVTECIKEYREQLEYTTIKETY